MNPDDVVLVEDRALDGGLIEVWTINREKNLNALNSAVLERVKKLARIFLNDYKKNHKLGVIVKGAGEKSFIAGADILEMKPLSAPEAKKFSELGHQAFGALETLPVPVIAAVDGFCLGGGLELAMGCDFIFASKKSKFGQPEASLGLIPGFGATARFVEKLGRSKALELFYSNDMITAEQALNLGLIERVIEEGSPFEAALTYLDRVFKKSGPLAIHEVKRIATWLHKERVDRICQEEAKTFGALFETQDVKEGISAFLEKRPPKFEGQ